MKKFKICPHCNTKNEPDSIECTECESDLTFVSITDEITEQVNPKSEIKSNDNKKHTLVRKCKCGNKNASNARKCNSCGEDIFDIKPIPDTDFNSIRFNLHSLDESFIFELKSNDIIMGRENILKEYLKTKTFVSRRHCRFSIENNELFIEDLGSKNFTYVNNERIKSKTKLFIGNEIGLGGFNINGTRQEKAAYFVIKAD